MCGHKILSPSQSEPLLEKPEDVSNASKDRNVRNTHPDMWEFERVLALYALNAEERRRDASTIFS